MITSGTGTANIKYFKYRCSLTVDPKFRSYKSSFNESYVKPSHEIWCFPRLICCEVTLKNKVRPLLPAHDK